MTEEQREVRHNVGRGNAVAMALGALNGGRATIRQVAERTGQEPHKSGAALYRLEKQGRVRKAGIDPQTRQVYFERVPGAEQAAVHAVIRAPRTGTIERMLELLGRLEQEAKLEREELGRLREENARLRKAMKELAARL